MFKALESLGDIIRVNNKTSGTKIATPVLPSGIAVPNRGLARPGSVSIIDPSAMKSTDLFSRNALEFINAVGNDTSSPYSEDQLLGAYLSSVYLYSALNRIANLISRVRIVGEFMKDNSWVRLPESHKLNELFAKDSAELLPRMWLNHAVYGSALVAKLKSRKAVLEEQSGRPIYDFKNGAVGGLVVLDKPLWDIDEDLSYGRVNGFYINQYDSPEGVLLNNRNYLESKEAIYFTEWNPRNPNRGKSKVAICIHEAVANAAIAQWISEYFTRGAMPFIMVSMAEDDPAMMTDADLRKYKREFEEYWQGLGSSLRSVFFDRKVQVEQVGIPADQVSAPELNAAALEGIAATMQLDRELIITPEGGSQERHALLIQRAWKDAVIPLLQSYLVVFNKELGLPPDMRLVADLSEISELDADRETLANVELQIFDGQAQSFNELRTRLHMAPVEELDGWFMSGGGIQPLEKIISISTVPHTEVVEYASQLWDSNLAKRSEILQLLGREAPANLRDGYKYEIEGQIDLVQSMWTDDLLTRKQTLEMLGYDQSTWNPEWQDGYRSELERGADYGDWVTSLWQDNLLTRKQVMKLLDIGVEVDPDMADGYQVEISDHHSNVIDMWSNNLLSRKEAMRNLGIPILADAEDGFMNEIEAIQEERQGRFDNIMSLWGDNMITRNQALVLLNMDNYSGEPDGYTAQIEREIEKKYSEDQTEFDQLSGLWDDGLITRSNIMNRLGIERPVDAVDGFRTEVETISTALAEHKGAELTASPEDEGGFPPTRSIHKPTDPDDDPDLPPKPKGPILPDDDGGAEAWADIVEYTETPTTRIQRLLSQPVLIEEDDEYIDEYGYDDGFEYGDDEEDDLVSEEDAGIDAAEEDYLANYGRYSFDPLPGSYGDMIDYLPPEVLPTEDVPDDYGISAVDILPSETITQIEEEVMAEEIERLQPPILAAPVDAIQSDMVAAPIIQTEVEEDNSIYISLWLESDPKISQIQEELSSLMGDDEAVEWQDPDKFHATLVYANDVDDIELDQILNILPTEFIPFALSITGLSVFENEEQTVIKLDVELSDELVQLQSKLATAFGTYNIPISEYSYAHNYKPHITLAYAPAGYKLPDYQASGVVIPSALSFGRSGYEIVDEIPVADIQYILSDPEATLDEADMFKTESERQADTAAFRNMIRNNIASRLYAWANNKPFAGGKANLPDHVMSVIKDLVDSDGKLSARMFKATQKAALNGEFDDNQTPSIETVNSYAESLGAIQEDVEAELKAWQKATLRKGVSKGVRFETQHIDAAISNKIKTELNNIEQNTESIIKVFTDARKDLGLSEG